MIAALAQPTEGRVETLAQALRAATPETAPLIVAALGRANRVEAVMVLEDAFASQGVTGRRAIAGILAAISASTSRSLLERAASQDPDEDVRQICATAAARG